MIVSTFSAPPSMPPPRHFTIFPPYSRSPHTTFRYLGSLGINLNFFTYSSNMDSHSIVSAVRFFLPNLLVDLFNGENLSPHASPETAKCGSQWESFFTLFAIHSHLLFLIVDPKPASLIYMDVFLRRHGSKAGIAAQLGFDPGHQFQRVKRFCYIVVPPRC